MIRQIYVIIFTLFLIFSTQTIYALESFFSDEEYVFSNYPESVLLPGLVFEKRIEKSKLRVFYHHKNISDSHMNIMFLLSNHSEESAVVKIQKGLGGSSKDVVFAGHKALTSFFSDILSQGDLVRIPANSTIPVIIHKIKSNQISSGIVRFEPFDTDKIELKMKIVDLEYDNLSGFSDVPSLMSQFRVSYFDESYRQIKEVFDLSDHYQTFQIGGEPYLKDKVSHFELKGNYGLLYAVEVVLTNLEDEYQRVEFFLAPTKKNGVDRGTFLIDGELVEVGILGYKENIVTMEMFHEVLVAPQESKKIYLMTMPQAGCFYPVDIVMKSKEV